MPFSWFDIVALVIVVGMCFRGWKQGGVTMIGNLASVVVGFIATAYIVSWINAYVLVGWSSSHPILAIVGFIVIFLLVTKLLGLAVSLLDTLFKIVSFIPLVGPANRLLGVVVGVVEGAFLILLVVYITATFLTALVTPSGPTYDIALHVARSLSLIFPSIPL